MWMPRSGNRRSGSDPFSLRPRHFLGHIPSSKNSARGKETGVAQQAENVRESEESPTPDSPGGLMRLAPRSGSVLGMIIKLIMLGLAVAIAIWRAIPLINAQNWIALGILILATIAMLYIYLTPTVIPGCTSFWTGSRATPHGTAYLVTEHPEWYDRDWKGDLRPTPWWDWDDIIDLDYTKPELRRYLAGAMAAGSARWTWTVTVVTLRVSCAPTSGTPSAGNSTRSNRCSCRPNGNPGTCMPRRST